MPTYEYICDACGHEFEKFQTMTSAPIKVCPKCGKKKVRKLISAGAGLIFKGSGFYITDYREGNYSEKAKADKDGGKPAETKTGDAKTETKAESKPAETKESKPAVEAKPAAPAPAPAKKESARKDSAKPSKKK